MPSAITTENIYDLVSTGLKGTDIQIVAPGQEGYEDGIRRWSKAAEKKAAAVVFPTSADDVSKIVKAARSNNIEFTVCCGGHATGGSSSIENGVAIDLRKMNKVTVKDKTLTVQGGCLWEHVDVEAAKYGLATVGGTVNHTGVGGLTLGGGFGYLSGKYGLVIDNLLSAELVLADGSIVRASETEHPDLFWAIRGCGSSFAICTEFVIQAYDQPNPVWAGMMGFTPDKLEALVSFANKFHETSAELEALFIGMGRAPPHFQPMIFTVVFYNGSEEDGKKFFEDLLKLEPVMDMTGMMPYEKVNAIFNPQTPHGNRLSTAASAMKYPFEVKLFQDIFDSILNWSGENEGTHGSMGMVAVFPYKKINTVPLNATAYANRGEYYHTEIVAAWTNPEDDLKSRAWGRSLVNMIRERGGTTNDLGVGAYLNNVEYQVSAKKGFGVNTERLKELKKVYDPDNIFYKWHDLFYDEKIKA